jgi:hypothetical protein
MRLPRAGRPDQEDVLPTVKILALQEFECRSACGRAILILRDREASRL